MRLRFFLSLLSLAFVACDGGSGGACVIDTDCPSFLDVCIEGSCQPAGTVSEGGTPPAMDAGEEEDAGETPMDAGEPTDAMPMDAAPTDAMPSDAMVADAEPTDAMATDAAVPVCDTPGTSWSISFVSAPASCGDAATGRPVAITPIDGMPCEFNATSPGEPALSGSFVLDEGGMVLGMMSAGSSAPMTCSGTYNATTPGFTIICGSCVMNLAPT